MWNRIHDKITHTLRQWYAFRRCHQLPAFPPHRYGYQTWGIFSIQHLAMSRNLHLGVCPSHFLQLDVDAQCYATWRALDMLRLWQHAPGQPPKMKRVSKFRTKKGNKLTSSIRRLGSGDITVRPEKSTRFPDKLPRKRPCFPFKRWQNPRSGFPYWTSVLGSDRFRLHIARSHLLEVNQVFLS